MKTTVIDKKSGKARVMESRFATILTKLGQARYMTRELRAAKPEEQGEEVKARTVAERKKLGRRPKAAK